MAVADGKHIDLKPLSSRCFLRQQTLLHFVSLNSDELMGTSDISLELTLQTTIIPSRGGGGGIALVQGCFILQKPGYQADTGVWASSRPRYAFAFITRSSLSGSLYNWFSRTGRWNKIDK